MKQNQCTENVCKSTKKTGPKTKQIICLTTAVVAFLGVIFSVAYFYRRALTAVLCESDDTMFDNE